MLGTQNGGVTRAKRLKAFQKFCSVESITKYEKLNHKIRELLFDFSISSDFLCKENIWWTGTQYGHCSKIANCFVKVGLSFAKFWFKRANEWPRHNIYLKLFWRTPSFRYFLILWSEKKNQHAIINQIIKYDNLKDTCRQKIECTKNWKSLGVTNWDFHKNSNPWSFSLLSISAGKLFRYYKDI